MTLIPLSQHPSNLDRTANLVSGPHYEGRDVYQVRGGYLATIENRAFLRLFPSFETARAAQREAAA